MKKVIVIMTVLFMVGVFASCQKKAEQEAPQVETEAVVDTTTIDSVAADTTSPATPE